jgi:hypothetical protein
MYVQIFKRKFSIRKIRKIYTVQFKKKLTTVCQKIYIEKHFESDNVEVFFELYISFDASKVFRQSPGTYTKN